MILHAYKNLVLVFLSFFFFFFFFFFLLELKFNGPVNNISSKQKTTEKDGIDERNA